MQAELGFDCGRLKFWASHNLARYTVASSFWRYGYFAEAWYNLVGLLDDQQRAREAVSCLALLLQRFEQPDKAATQWRRYLELDRVSPGPPRQARAKLCAMQITLS
jgi:hypothetical protein